MKLKFQLSSRIVAEGKRQHQVHLSIMDELRFDLPYRQCDTAHLRPDVGGIGSHTVFSSYAKNAAEKHVCRKPAVPAVAVTHTRAGNPGAAQVDVDQHTAVP